MMIIPFIAFGIIISITGQPKRKGRYETLLKVYFAIYIIASQCVNLFISIGKDNASYAELAYELFETVVYVTFIFLCFVIRRRVDKLSLSDVDKFLTDAFGGSGNIAGPVLFILLRR